MAEFSKDPVDPVVEYQQCQQIINYLRNKKSATTYQINKALSVDSKMIMRRKRFQEYFVPNPQKNNDFSLNHKSLQTLNYRLPTHPSEIPIKPPKFPHDNLIIQYKHHIHDARISFLATSSITPNLFQRSSFIALDLEGFDETNTSYSIAQLSADDEIALLFDRLRGGDEVHQLLLSTLQHLPDLQYIFLHDCTCDVQALSRGFVEALTSNEGSSGLQKYIIDTQIIFEYFNHEVYTGFNKVIQSFVPESQKLSHSSKIDIGRKMKEDDHYWEKRDLTSVQIHYAAMDVLLLNQAIPFILQKIHEEAKTEGLLDVFINATKKRMNYIFETQERYVMIHPTEHYLMSSELVEALADISTADSIYHQMIIQQQKTSLLQIRGVDSVFSLLLEIFPSKHHLIIETAVHDLKSTSLTLYVAQPKTQENDVRSVLSEEEFPRVVEQLRHHSIPHIFSAEQATLTISFPSKTIVGQSLMMSDLLFHNTHAQSHLLIISALPRSLLATSLLRDFAVLLSSSFKVIYIDSHNQLATSDVTTIEKIIGRAVRVPVTDLDEQAVVIRSSVTNFRPNIIVVDDIRTMDDVRAIELCKTHNIRVIAGCSSVRSFRELIQSEPFKLLIGGPTSVPQSRDRYQGRSSTDLVIELEENGVDYRIIRDAAKTAENLVQYGKGQGTIRKRSIMTKNENDKLGRDDVIQRMAHYFIDVY